jgi:hypothetical protein
MADLRETVRAILPAKVLALMDEIEDFARLHISVEMNPHTR